MRLVQHLCQQSEGQNKSATVESLDQSLFKKLLQQLFHSMFSKALSAILCEKSVMKSYYDALIKNGILYSDQIQASSYFYLFQRLSTEVRNLLYLFQRFNAKLTTD